MQTKDQQQLKEQLIEKVSQLCKAFLQFESVLTVEGLLGITLDQREIILVNINETLTPTVAVSGSVDTNLSQPETSEPDPRKCIAPANGNTRPSKRKRPKESVQTTTACMRPPSLRTAKRKRSCSGLRSSTSLARVGSDSGGLETRIVLQRLDTAVEDVAAYPKILHDHEERHCAVVKEETCESVVDSCDVGTESMETDRQRDDNAVNTETTQCCIQSTAAAADDDDDDDELSKTSEEQSMMSPDNSSSVADSSQLVISNVFSVKQEPVLSDDVASTLSCDLRSELIDPTSQTPDPGLLEDESNPLQVIFILFA